jgi:hypothetical protein
MIATKEQLELAAKAAGYKLSWFRREGFEPQPTIGDGAWHPTTDKSDSFDLMVACGISVSFEPENDLVTATDTYSWEYSSIDIKPEHNNNDKGLATMAAVFLCAVEIGRGM